MCVLHLYGHTHYCPFILLQYKHTRPITLISKLLAQYCQLVFCVSVYVLLPNCGMPYMVDLSMAIITFCRCQDPP